MKPLKAKLITLILIMVSAAYATGCAKEKPPSAAFTMDQARTLAIAEVPGGKIKAEEYEKEEGHWVYIFDITLAGGDREVWVDPQSGKIVKNKAD